MAASVASAGGRSIVDHRLRRVVVFEIAALWQVFVKGGHPGWAAIIPFYNYYVLLKVVGRPGWWLILYFIPLVNIIVWIIVAIDLSKSFAKTSGFAVGLILLAFIFIPILGFGPASTPGRRRQDRERSEPPRPSLVAVPQPGHGCIVCERAGPRPRRCRRRPPRGGTARSRVHQCVLGRRDHERRLLPHPRPNARSAAAPFSEGPPGLPAIGEGISQGCQREHQRSGALRTPAARRRPGRDQLLPEFPRLPEFPELPEEPELPVLPEPEFPELPELPELP